MEIKNIEVFNFEGAFRGMRAPMESWNKSDSYFGFINEEYPTDEHEEVIDKWVEQELKRKHIHAEAYGDIWEELWDRYNKWLYSNEILKSKYDISEVATIGPNDLALAQKLILSGSDHSKFMRQIFVSMDITAMKAWWSEMDTYKVSTVANSTSTMHKLTSKPIIEEDFSFSTDWDFDFNLAKKHIINACESLRQKYIETKDKRYWRALIELLPQSYNQTRTWTANYAVLRNIYFSRKNHKLKEWHEFCEMIEKLPYGGELICIE